MKKKIALITGVTGQDGSIMAEYLLQKGYIVHGIKRRTSIFHTKRIDHFLEDKHSSRSKFFLHFGDVNDPLSCINLINVIKPDEIYHFAAQSHVAISFEMPHYTTSTDSLGTLNLLEAIRINKKKNIKFYNASSSEIYGNSQKKVLNEKSLFDPASPYAAAKLNAFYLTKIYRVSYGIFASNGILFNHESELRGETFVTRKITMFVAKYYFKRKGLLLLGNLNSSRDWGYARDFIKGIWKIMQHNKPDDFVLATNKSYSVKQFVIESFKNIKVDIVFKNISGKTIGLDKKTKKIIIKSIDYYLRPNDVNHLKGNYNKAKKVLKWKPEVGFKKLVKIMVENDINLIKDSYR